MAEFVVRIARTYYCEVTVSGDNARAVRKRLNDYGLDLVPSDFPNVVDDHMTARIVSIKPEGTGQ